MTGAEQRARENELFDEGRAEAADEWFANAVQQYLRDGTLAELVDLVAFACEVRAAAKQTTDRMAAKWEAAAAVLKLVTQDDEIKNIP